MPTNIPVSTIHLNDVSVVQLGIHGAIAKFGVDVGWGMFDFGASTQPTAMGDRRKKPFKYLML
ncbi:hypothetical protein [Coleofasciculus sp.]|uniref:hypothetical protein n=1 Tax=Coleofasciculus sp. TaxID=3100458 RepID=UPI003A33176D